MPTTLTTRSQRRWHWRSALWIAAFHAASIVFAIAAFMAYRVYVHDATFASRQTFWIGSIHQEHAAVGFAMAPDRRGIAVLEHGIAEPERRIPVRTDARGFRVPIDSEPAAVRPGGLVAIGCSCTFGHGVPAESTYVYLAAAELGLPAYNLGVCSYSAVTSIEFLRQHVATLQPTAVVYGYGNFHLERSQRPRTDVSIFQSYLASKGDSSWVVPPRFDNHVFFANSSRVEQEYYKPKLTGQETQPSLARLRAVLPLALQDLERLTHRDYLRLRFETHALPETTFTRWVVQELIDVSRQGGARATLMFFPAFLGEQPFPSLLEAVESHAAEDFLFVDAAPRLSSGIPDQQAYSDRWQVPRDGHPNSRMHLEMARAIVESFRARGWQSLPGSAP